MILDFMDCSTINGTMILELLCRYRQGIKHSVTAPSHHNADNQLIGNEIVSINK